MPLPELKKLKYSPREVVHLSCGDGSPDFEMARKTTVPKVWSRWGFGSRSPGTRADPPDSTQLLFWVIPVPRVDETLKADFPAAPSRHSRSRDCFRNGGVFLGSPALPEIPAFPQLHAGL